MSKRTNNIKDSIYNNTIDLSDKSINRDFGEEVKREIINFTFFGAHDYLDEEDRPTLFGGSEASKVFARLIIINNKKKFYIKEDGSGRFFNPIGFDEGNHNKKIYNTAKDAYSFKDVSKKVFDFYINFLKTKNLAYLHNAERENV